MTNQVISYITLALIGLALILFTAGVTSPVGVGSAEL
jgi:hypothetical protein